MGRPIYDELEFIDSTGTAIIVAANRRPNVNGDQGFRLVRSRALAVCRVLALTGLDKSILLVDA